MSSAPVAFAAARRPISNRARGALGIAISAVSLAAAIWWASRQEAPSFPTSASALTLLVLALGVYAVATVIRGWRWHAVMRLADVDHKPLDAYRLVVVGYMGNTILPARGGELLRVLLLGERSNSRRRQILGSIVAERVLDAAVLVALFAVMTWSQVAGAPAGQAPATVATLAVGVAAISVAVYLRARRRGRFERFADLVRPFARPTKLIVGRSGAALAVVTALVWVLEGVGFLLIGRALDIELNLVDTTFLVVLASFFALAPAAPGYVGTFDAGLLLGLNALDVTGGAAVSFVLLVRFVNFVPITIVGLLLLLTRYGGIRNLRRRTTSESAAVDSPAAAVPHESRDDATSCALPTRSTGDESSRWFWDHYDGAAGEVISFLEGDGISLTGRRVADIGCGDGIIDLGVAHRAAPAQLVGFDITPIDLDHLAELASKEGVDPSLPRCLEFRTSDVTRLPADDSSFDIVFTWSAFEHVADPTALLRDMHRVLVPDGVLMLQLWPFFHSEHGSHLWKWFPEGFVQLLRSTEEIEDFVRANSDDDPAWAEYMLGEYKTLNRITLDELHQCLLAAEFRVGKIELVSGPVHIPAELSRSPLSLLAISGVKLLATAI
jgi:uncharacterized protein (TIRG00374 family)